MAETLATTNVPVELWTDADLESTSEEHAHDGTRAHLGIEHGDERNEVSLHLFIDGRGSLCSYVLDREAALGLALRLLHAAGVE